MTGRALAEGVDQATRDNLALVGKSLVFVIGGVLAVSAAVELKVGGWSVRAAGYLAAGLLLCGAPLAWAFRDALIAGRQGGS